jgi:transposase-like protein
LKPTNDSWRTDETYIKVKGQWKYLYRAVEFMAAAKRFFTKKVKKSILKQPAEAADCIRMRNMIVMRWYNPIIAYIVIPPF